MEVIFHYCASCGRRTLLDSYTKWCAGCTDHWRICHAATPAWQHAVTEHPEVGP